MKNIKKLLILNTILNTIFVLFLTSCVNEVNKSESSLSFSLGKENANVISSNISRNKIINDSTEIKVDAIILKNNEEIVTSESFYTTVKEIGNLPIRLTKIPFGNNYNLHLSILYNGYPLYEGKSSSFNVTKENPNVTSLSVSLNQKINTISYNLNGGEFPLSKTIISSYTINDDIPLETPLLDNKTFIGWYLDPLFESEKITRVGSKNYLGDVTLYAKWEDESSTITYNCGNENTISPKIIEKDYLLSFKDLPTKDDYSFLEKEGYTFLGWYIGEEKIEEGYKVTNDITLNAKWSEIKYTISYDLSQGSFITPEAVVYSYDITKEVILPEVERKGYIFDGWFLDESKTLNKVTKIEKGSVGNKVLYAKFSERGKTSDVEIKGSLDNTVCKTGSEISLSCPTPNSVIYYTTDGTDPLTNGKEYKTPLNILPNTTLKVYAKTPSLKDSNVISLTFSERKYKVSFISQFFSAPPVYLREGERVINPLTLSKEGYKIEKWILLDHSSDHEVIWDFSVNTVGNKDITLKAVWKPITYRVTYDANSIEGVSGITEEKTWDTPFTISDNGLKEEGYITSWNTSSDGNGVDYKVGELVNNLTSTQGEEIILYARKTPITYTVRLDLKGAEGVAEEIQCTYGTLFEVPNYRPFTLNGFIPLNYWIGPNGEKLECGSQVSNLTNINNAIVTLSAVWLDVKPSDVIDLKAITNLGEINLTWTNPSDTDLKQVIVTCDNPEVAEVPPISAKPNEKGNVLFSNLANNKEYKFHIKTIDNNENVGTDIEYKVSLYAINDYPVRLPDYISECIPYLKNPETDIGTGGIGKFEYVAYGNWPQTHLIDESVITDKSKTVTINGTNDQNGFQCYVGNDGYYYVKQKAKLADINNSYFRDGQKIVEGKDYYFRMEPIVWRNIERGQYNRMICDKGIDCHRFAPKKDPVPIDVYYSTSEIKAYLNGLSNEGSDEYKDKGFLQKAFTKEGVKAIYKAHDNDILSMDMSDGYVYLMYAGRLRNPDYGFHDTSYSNAKINGRRILVTDYAIAKGVAYKKDTYCCKWWIQYNQAGYINEVGDLDYPIKPQENPKVNYFAEDIAVVPGINVCY